MFPEQQPPNTGQQPPQPPYPTPPQYSYGSAPQQAANGQYQVVPPLPAANNTGHSGHNPYEFIVNPHPQKHGVNLLGGSSLLARVAVIGGGLVVLMIIAAIVISAFGPKSNTADLIAVAQRQQEISRVATAANDQATQQDTKDFVMNVSVSLTSDQKQMLAYLADHGAKKISPKELALDKNPQTDTLLSNAAAAGNYDPTAIQSLTSQLQAYEQQLQTTFQKTKGPNARALLQRCFKNADLLLQQAKSASAS